MISTIKEIANNPLFYAHSLGYDKLTSLHNEWIKTLMYRQEDYTLQAHRESYKTTCLIIAITLLMVFEPDDPILLLRKDQDSVAEVTRAVKRNLENPVTQDLAMMLWGKSITFEKATTSELHTNLSNTKKESQFLGDGIRSFSITGKHFQRIFTDDIITLKDRLSRAERLITDSVYDELQNVKMSGGAILNTGTPWHKDDTFRKMPKPEKWTVLDTGIMNEKEVNNRRKNMSASLFSANYELKHIADAESMFREPKYANYPNKDGIAQIDCAYGGGDTIAVSIATTKGKDVFVVGKVFEGHVQDHYNSIQEFLRKYKAGTLYNETNADKGYFAKEFRKYWSVIKTYHEKMNKHLKISTYLKGDWDNIYLANETDREYINQIVDYQEGGAPDDAPDSLASLLREMGRGKVQTIDKGAFGL